MNISRLAAAGVFLLLVLVATPTLAAEVVLVHEGMPRAEIVISENPLRTVRLAAHELQTYVEKISGARLPIVNQPSPGRTPIYVGRSEHAERLQVNAEELRDGAYRIVAHDGWLALIGYDDEFTPVEPWARNNAEIVSGKLQREWEAITGAPWGVPNNTLYKNRFRLPGETGLTDQQRAAGDKHPPLEMWAYDERGSFNAVCGLLMKLGVRWYAPGEAGEVVPKLPTIAVSEMDETVRPDFPIRRFNVRLGVYGHDIAMWSMRLGMRDPHGVGVAHGMDTMTQRQEIFDKHPDWFALYGGRRQNLPGLSNNQLCYSNQELFEQTVRWVRAQFDHYDYEMVSVMPPDGYTAICQCELCAGKDSPERDQRGRLSNYVWDFVNRVAKEVGRTHPHKKILNCAYGVYTQPPTNIEKLEPNLVVSIVGGRRPVNNRPEDQAAIRKLREGWLEKTDNPLIIFENYPFTDRGWYLPSFTAHSLVNTVNDIKGISQGEDIWLSLRLDFDKIGLGFNHFLVYFTQRAYWGGKDLDADALLREYCRLFYGPADQEMQTFFDYCEHHWQEMEQDKDKADHALELFAAAQARVEPSSIYAVRLGWIDDYLKGLRSKSQQLGRQRGPVPVLRLVNEPRTKIVIDGKLDDDAWVNAFASSTIRLRELQTGRQPLFGTTVKANWIGKDLYLAIRCAEAPGEKPNIAATRNGDPAIWYGDCVEVLLETDATSYYQIAVSPAGAVVDLDRSAPRDRWFSWSSQAEVATHIADDHWIVEMRIPTTEDANDPLHQVIGRKPTRSLPWFINICRQRLREDGAEHSAFSPTGSESFHDAMKFAHFFGGNSFRFDAGPPDDDFLLAIAQATDLARSGQREAALEAWLAAADGKAGARKLSDLQKSHALEQAAAAARGLRQMDKADEIGDRIPIAAVQKTVRMQNLLDRFQGARIIKQYGEEDLAAWPFWKRGDGYFARGRAYFAAKRGPEAEADLTQALVWSSDPRLRDSIRLALGSNRLANLQDEDGALQAWQAIVADAGQIGGADQFAALQAIARVQAGRKEFDAALATLEQAQVDKLTGFWRDSMRLAQGDVLLAAGKKYEALAAYRRVAEGEGVEGRLRKTAQERIATLSPE